VARRKDSSALDDAFELLKLTPIWVGPVLAVISFLLLRYAAPLMFPVRDKGIDAGIILRQFLPILAWLLAGGILLAWIAAEVHKLFNRQLLDRQTGIDSIRTLSWKEFERLLCEAYRRKGYLAQVVGSACGDGGVDIELTGPGEAVVVQCKQWRAYKVGVQTVRELLGIVVSRRATRGVLVTSGRFTKEAVLFAKQNSQIELLDGPRVTELIADVRAKQGSAARAVASVDQPGRTTPPKCSDCGAEMVLRTARRGTNAGSRFWGCSKYPTCRGIREA
jgi:restriction system protein